MQNCCALSALVAASSSCVISAGVFDGRKPQYFQKPFMTGMYIGKIDGNKTGREFVGFNIGSHSNTLHDHARWQIDNPCMDACTQWAVEPRTHHVLPSSLLEIKPRLHWDHSTDLQAVLPHHRH